jgi:hypothetical protein
VVVVVTGTVVDVVDVVVVDVVVDVVVEAWCAVVLVLLDASEPSSRPWNTSADAETATTATASPAPTRIRFLPSLATSCGSASPAPRLRDLAR